MITNFEEETDELSKKEKELIPIIVDGLKVKIGKSQAVTATVIIKAFRNRGTKIDPARMRKMINYIRINDLIPCLVSSHKGYHVSVDDQEILEYRNSLRERAAAILALEEAIRRQQLGRNKQNSMF